MGKLFFKNVYEWCQKTDDDDHFGLTNLIAGTTWLNSGLGVVVHLYKNFCSAPVDVTARDKFKMRFFLNFVDGDCTGCTGQP